MSSTYEHCSENKRHSYKFEVFHSDENYVTVFRLSTPHRRPRRRWENNIKMDIQEVGWRGGGAWTGLIWLRIGTGDGHLYIGKCVNEPSGSIKAGNLLAS